MTYEITPSLNKFGNTNNFIENSIKSNCSIYIMTIKSRLKKCFTIGWKMISQFETRKKPNIVF